SSGHLGYYAIYAASAAKVPLGSACCVVSSGAALSDAGDGSLTDFAKPTRRTPSCICGKARRKTVVCDSAVAALADCNRPPGTSARRSLDNHSRTPLHVSFRGRRPMLGHLH